MDIRFDWNAPRRVLAPLGSPLVGSLAPLAVGLALGALATAIIAPAPRLEARVVHPARIAPAAGPADPALPVIRFAAVPRADPEPEPEPPPEAEPAWRRFAVAGPPSDGRPMIALIIDDMGLDRRRSRRAAALPAPLTLAYLPHGRGLVEQTRAARARGHELLVHVPMEGGAPSGAGTLRSRYSRDELLRRLDWSLGRFEGFVGINNHMGSRFTADARGLRVVLGALARRGLLFVDSKTTPDSVAPSLARDVGLPFARRDVFLDHDPGKSAIEAQLARLERIARRRGYAVAIGHPHARTIDALAAWIPEARRRGFDLVPITAIVARRTMVGSRAPAESPDRLGG